MMALVFYIVLGCWLVGVAFFGASGDSVRTSLLWPVDVLTEWRRRRRLRKLLDEAWRR